MMKQTSAPINPGDGRVTTTTLEVELRRKVPLPVFSYCLYFRLSVLRLTPFFRHGLSIIVTRKECQE